MAIFVIASISVVYMLIEAVIYCVLSAAHIKIEITTFGTKAINTTFTDSVYPNANIREGVGKLADMSSGSGATLANYPILPLHHQWANIENVLSWSG